MDMNQKFQQLHRDHVSRRLKSIRVVTPPPGGWIRTIRDALSMSASQLARRVGVTQPAVVQWEEGERAETISLATLRKVAAAMECDFTYAFVPRKPLDKIIEDQALVRATRMVDAVSHSMELEGQKTSATRRRASIRADVDLLLKESPGKIWNDGSSRP